MVEKEGRKQRQECQVEALERIQQKFGFRSPGEMGQAMNVPRSTMYRAMDRSKFCLLAKDNRRNIARFLGCQSRDEEALEVLLDEIEWEMVTEEESEEALAYVVGDAGVWRGGRACRVGGAPYQ